MIGPVHAVPDAENPRRIRGRIDLVHDQIRPHRNQLAGADG